jgi:hypothetical protein
MPKETPGADAAPFTRGLKSATRDMSWIKDMSPDFYLNPDRDARINFFQKGCDNNTADDSSNRSDESEYGDEDEDDY